MDQAIAMAQYDVGKIQKQSLKIEEDGDMVVMGGCVGAGGLRTAQKLPRYG